MADKFGMMSQAYFKGKRELLEWLTDLLQMDIPKVETLASGAHYCQLLDACHPGSIKMSKVNFAARTEDQFVANWKLIQIAFEKKGIQKLIPVLRLIKARFQDNLEFLQWFHQYFQTTYRDTGYDAPARRKKCKGANTVRARTAKPNSQRPAYGQKRSRVNQREAGAEGPTANATSRRTGASNGVSRQNSQANAAALREQADRVKALQTEKSMVEAELARISKTAQLIENERDFYFKILLKVETMCKESPTPDHPCIKKIIQVLYESNEDSPKNAAQEANPQKPVEAGAGKPAPEPMAECNPNPTDDPPKSPAPADKTIDLGQGSPLVDMLNNDSVMVEP